MKPDAAVSSPRHVMLVLGLLSVRPNAAIMYINAAKFDPHRNDIDEEFLVGIDLFASYQRSWAEKFDISAEGILWWLQPGQEEERRRWLKLEPLDLATAAHGFSQWLGKPPIYRRMWSGGDIPHAIVLRTTYNLLGMECPWDSCDERCSSTLIAEGGWRCSGLPPLPKASSARSQARYLQAAYPRNWSD